MKEIRSIEIWFINDKYYLQAYSVTVDGIRYSGKNPVHLVAANEKPILGEQVLNTLNDCQFGIPNPPLKDNTDIKQFHTLVGVKSEKELMKKGKSVSVYLENDKVEISSWYFDGRALSCIKGDLYSSLNPDDITRTVLAAFERCAK